MSLLVLGCPPRWMACCKRNGPKSPAFVVKPREVGCSVLEQPISSDSSKTVANAFKWVSLPNGDVSDGGGHQALEFADGRARPPFAPRKSSALQNAFDPTWKGS